MINKIKSLLFGTGLRVTERLLEMDKRLQKINEAFEAIPQELMTITVNGQVLFSKRVRITEFIDDSLYPKYLVYRAYPDSRFDPFIEFATIIKEETANVNSDE